VPNDRQPEVFGGRRTSVLHRDPPARLFQGIPCRQNFACRPPSASPSCRHVRFSEAEAAAIRTAFDRRGELSAAVELRRLFPGVTDNAQARECARIIAAWEARCRP
jgi:hypothetical protein